MATTHASVVISKGGGTPIIVGLLPSATTTGRTTTATVLSVARYMHVHVALISGHSARVVHSIELYILVECNAVWDNKPIILNLHVVATGLDLCIQLSCTSGMQCSMGRSDVVVHFVYSPWTEAGRDVVCVDEAQQLTPVRPGKTISQSRGGA